MSDTVEQSWRYLHASTPVPDDLLRALREDDTVEGRCALLAALRGRPEVTRTQADEWARTLPDEQPARAALAFRVAHIYLALGFPREAARVAESSGEGAPGELTGALVLVRVAALARYGEFDAALSLLDSVEGSATLVESSRWHTEFGPGNLAAHRVHVLAKAGRFDEAFAAVADPALQTLSVERRRHVVADLAACRPAV